MKDLKHLIYFENLLQEANNELVQQAVKEGKKAIGYTCFARSAAESRRLFFGETSRASYGLYGYRDVLPQQLPLRILQGVARTRHRGRIQLPFGDTYLGNLQRNEPQYGTFQTAEPYPQR